MLARADSLEIPGRSTPSPAVPPVGFPAWARPGKPPQSEAEAAFFAGAALARLDAIVRENPPWAGVWRQRLALRAAVACVSRAGRAEGEGALRDTLHLTRPGADPGPAGRRLLAWRALTAGSTGRWPSAVDLAAEVLGLAQNDALQPAIEAAQACAGVAQPAPFAVARAFDIANRALAPSGGRPSTGDRGGEGELLAAGLADAVLAHKLRWPFVLPLLAAGLGSADGRRRPGGEEEGGPTTPILYAYAKAAAQACDLAAELGRRAEKLREVAPKMRAKGTGAALAGLLDDDCLSAATPIKGLSERGARRLFERLVALGAIRELTGRKTFRLYGL